MPETASYSSTEDAAARRIARQALDAEGKRRAAKRTETFVYYLVVTVGVLLSGWLFMLAVGIARANWIPGFQTVDYGTATLLMALLHSAWMFQALGRAVRKSSL